MGDGDSPRRGIVATISSRSNVELGMMGGILIAMFWGGSNFQGLKSAQENGATKMTSIEQKLESMPTKDQVTLLIENSVLRSTADLRQEIGKLQQAQATFDRELKEIKKP